MINQLKHKTSSTLNEEISFANKVIQPKRDHLILVLTDLGISSLKEVTVPVLTSYNRYIFKEFFGKPNKYSSYKGDLEQALFTYYQNTGHVLFSEPFPVSVEVSAYRKLMVFLIASGITQFDQITGALRYSYEEYLKLTVPKKVTEHTKAMDLLKQFYIKKLPFVKTPRYDNVIFYLAYYPDASIANRFFYTAKKNFLFFDFSRNAPENMKRQIFDCLITTLQTGQDYSNHYFLQNLITPLYYLYDFCCEMRIDNILKITRKEALQFPEFLDSHMDSTIKTASQILYRVRKMLFLSANTTDFSSYVWFLERFPLEDTRVNPTRTIDAFYFDDVENPYHREIFQDYMKYLLVLSPKFSLKKLLAKYYSAKKFLCFLDARNILLSRLTADDIQIYVAYKGSLPLHPDTFNTEMFHLKSFLSCIATRNNMVIPDFSFDYYLKKSFHVHHDRSVPEKESDKILNVLYRFPEYLGLMYLTLYSTGLRINEVCALKRDALFINNNTYWLKCYQYKMRTEKEIPIPEDLYFLLTRYIEKSEVSSIYIFPSVKNAKKPFQTGTFTSQMNRWLRKYKSTQDIHFKSHDYRHTIVTDIFDSGAGLPTAREFAGHKNENMTKEYIDHRPSKIDRLQQQYFSENDL